MAWFESQNQYRRHVIIIDVFDDGTEKLTKHESELVSPPCSHGSGCRASDYDSEACGFDPKTGLCNGRMA